MKRAVAYCRVSTDKENQLHSLENQKEYFNGYISNDKELEFVGIYADEGITGTSIKKRDEFNRMILDGKGGKFDVILTKSVSRFARNILDTIGFVRELKKRNIEVRFITDGINSFQNDAELRLGFLATFAQDESRQTSEKVVYGQSISMKNGVVFGNNMLGYNVVNGKMTINEDEAPIVRKIFHKYLIEGKGAHLIAKELQEEGIKTKRGGNKWNNTSVYKILKNEKYCGDLIQQKTYTPDYLSHEKKYNKGEREFIEIKNHHEPIIDRETFVKVQEEIKRRKNKAKVDGSKHSNRYALSGKIKCGSCGCAYVGGDNRKRKDGSVRKSWKCYEKHKYGKKHINSQGDYIGCDNDNVNNDIVLNTFNQLIKKITLTDKEEIINNTLKVISSTIKNNCSLNADEERLHQRKEKLQEQIKKAISLCISGIITDEQLKEQKTELENELNLVCKELENTKSKQQLLQDKEMLLENIKQSMNELLNFETTSEHICKEVLEKVVVKSKNEFDFYIKGVSTPFLLNYKGVILDTMFLYR
ncbi:MAG: recombinase family protein [Clostridia bacterium]